MSEQRARIPLEELRQLHLMQGVDLAAVEPLLRGCPVEAFASGQVVIRAGHQNRYLYLILSGLIRVHLKSPQDEPIAVLSPGESFGELSMIDDRPASAYVVADTPARLLSVDEDTMWTLVHRSHAVSSNLLVTLSQRIRFGNEVIYQSEQQLREYRFQALVDPLTGLYNRRWLDKMLPRQMDRCRRDGQAMSLLMIDIDHFKRYNDEYGHQAGDRVLASVAKVLQGAVRPGDLLARYGGEEIVVLLPDADMRAAATTAQRLGEQVRRCEVDSGADERLPTVTVSIGVAEKTATSTCDTLIGAADHAMYRAKQAGRDRYSL